MAEHFSIRTPALSLGKPRDVDEKENWPVLVVLASGSLVEPEPRPNSNPPTRRSRPGKPSNPPNAASTASTACDSSATTSPPTSTTWPPASPTTQTDRTTRHSPTDKTVPHGLTTPKPTVGHSRKHVRPAYR